MATFFPRNGLIAFEIESDQPGSGWRATSQYPDDSGNMAYRYVGPNDYQAPPAAGTVMEYTFKVETAGTYFLSIRSRRELDGRTLKENHQANGPNEVAKDEENDFWVTVDSGAWKKIFFGGNFGTWAWAQTFDVNHSKSAAAYSLGVGTHTFKIGGRSEGAIADRVHLNLGSVNKDDDAPLSPTGPGGGTPPPPPPPTDPEPPVSGDPLNVFLVDTTSDKVIAQITKGGSIDASLVEGKTVSIYAEVKSGSSLAGKVGSVVLDYQNGAVKTTENVAPYALFGDKNGDFFPGLKIGAGSYSIDFDVYSGKGGGGSRLASSDFDFTIKGGSSGSGGSGGGGGVPKIGDADADVIVFLVDVKTGAKILEVGDNARISRTELANKSLALVAEARDGGRLDGKVGSMKLDFEDGEIVRVDNVEPFAVFGESGSALTGRTLGRGYYDLDIYSYAGANASGGLLDTYKHDFEVF